jgi:hypothetical protein
MLKSPQQKQEVMPSRLLRKRVRQATRIQEIEKDKGLRERMGFEKQKPYKRPAAKAKSSCQRPPAFKKPASSKKNPWERGNQWNLCKRVQQEARTKSLAG